MRSRPDVEQSQGEPGAAADQVRAALAGISREALWTAVAPATAFKRVIFATLCEEHEWREFTDRAWGESFKAVACATAVHSASRETMAMVSFALGSESGCSWVQVPHPLVASSSEAG
jgi:hypothetical protein